MSLLLACFHFPLSPWWMYKASASPNKAKTYSVHSTLKHCLVWDEMRFNKTGKGQCSEKTSCYGANADARRSKNIWIVTFSTESVSLVLFFITPCNAQCRRCTIGHTTISSSLYVLMDPFFTFCVILSFSACSWLSSCTAVLAHQWGSPLLS